MFKVIGKQDPNFTVRRQQANMQQEMEKIQSVKKVSERNFVLTILVFVLIIIFINNGISCSPLVGHGRAVRY